VIAASTDAYVRSPSRFAETLGFGDQEIASTAILVKQTAVVRERRGGQVVPEQRMTHLVERQRASSLAVVGDGEDEMRRHPVRLLHDEAPRKEIGDSSGPQRHPCIPALAGLVLSDGFDMHASRL